MIRQQQTRSWFQIAILGLLFVVSMSVRLFDLDDPPLDFHPARQLHSALMARGFYLENGGHLPGASTEYESEARMRGVQEPWIEPPVLEKLTSWSYKLAGDADLRIPRVLSIVCWLAGGWGLLVFCRRTLRFSGQLAALGFFLLYPYAVSASRSFQPDPLMVALMIWSLTMISAWAAEPTLKRAVWAGLLTGAAIFVKQVSVFPLLAAYAFMILASPDRKRRLTSLGFWLIIVLSALPVLLYNYWGVFIDGFLAQQYQGRFFFSELISPAFYVRWLRQLDQVFTLPLFVLALAGCLTHPERRIRILWLGYLAGYIVYGCVLPHHIGTHDYYQLPLFPLVAFGLGALVQILFDSIDRIAKRADFARGAVTLLLLILMLWWTAESLMTLKRADYRVWPERWQKLATELDPYPGQINTIGVMEDYGAGMVYWGLRTPMILDQSIEKLEPEMADQKLRQALINREYLIVTDLAGFYQQPRLQNWLMRNVSLMIEMEDCLVYDLRELHD